MTDDTISSASDQGVTVAGDTAGETEGERIVREITARLDLDSRFSMDLRPQPNSLMMAKTLGGVIESMADLIKAVDGRTVLMIEGMRSTPDGALTVDFLCARTPANPPSSTDPVSNADET